MPVTVFSQNKGKFWRLWDCKVNRNMQLDANLPVHYLTPKRISTSSKCVCVLMINSWLSLGFINPLHLHGKEKGERLEGNDKQGECVSEFSQS